MPTYLPTSQVDGGSSSADSLSSQLCQGLFQVDKRKEGERANLKWKQLNRVGSLRLITLPSDLPRAHTEMFDVERRYFRMTLDSASPDRFFF